jgi:hypothetical protein
VAHDPAILRQTVPNLTQKRRQSASPARRRHRERERRDSRRFAAGSNSQIPARSIDGALGKRYHTARGLDEILDR